MVKNSATSKHVPPKLGTTGREGMQNIARRCPEHNARHSDEGMQVMEREREYVWVCAKERRKEHVGDGRAGGYSQAKSHAN